MNKESIKITATTRGRSQYIPGYHQRKYLEEGDIPNHIAVALAFIREELKPNEKVIVQQGKLCIVEKTALDRFVEWVAGRGPEKSAARSRIFSYFQSPVLNPEG